MKQAIIRFLYRLLDHLEHPEHYCDYISTPWVPPEDAPEGSTYMTIDGEVMEKRNGEWINTNKMMTDLFDKSEEITDETK